MSFKEIYLNLRTMKHTRYTDTDILNKKIYLVYNYLSFKEIYLKSNATMAAIRNLAFSVVYFKS